MKDTIRQLIQSGELEGVSLNETSVANIAEKVSANQPMNQGHHGKDQGHEGKKGGKTLYATSFEERNPWGSHIQ